MSLLDAPSPAVLGVYRRDGSTVINPVWYRLEGDQFEVVMAAFDPKLAHLRADPRCVLLVFEVAPPFRALEVRAEGSLNGVGVGEVRLAIASRYLGADRGRRFAEQRGARGFVLRLPAKNARAWDLAAILPPEVG